MRHLVELVDLDVDEVLQVLELSALPVAQLGRPLEGAGAALIFEKPSNRTRHSMEMAVVQLGGHPVYTRGDEVGFDVRETVEDVAHIMAGYHAVLAARVFEHDTVRRFAAASAVPVVNMLSDHSHPLQALADMFTMQQALGSVAGRIVAYVGDYTNVSRSLAEISVMLGMRVQLGCPLGYHATTDELERLDALGAGSVEQWHDAAAAVAGAHVVHTDTWTSMGRESQKKERLEVFGRFQVNASLMSHAAQNVWFMHCLPAYRGLEVTADVIDGARSLVVAQGHNRMHTARGALAFLLGVRP